MSRAPGKETRFAVQARIIFLLSVLAVIFLIFLCWAHKNEDRQIETFLGDREKQFSSHFSQMLKLFQRSVEIVTYEYSLWDEMVEFVQKKDKKWATDNIDFLLRQYGFAAAWIFDPQRSLVHRARVAGTDDLRFTPEMQQQLFSSGYGCHFFLPTSHGLLELFGAKIQPTSDNKRITPANGYLFLGRLWDEKLISELGRLTESVVTLDKDGGAPAGTVSRRENETLTLTEPLMGWEGKPVARLCIQNVTPIIGEMKASGNKELFFMMTFICSILAFLSVSLWLWVGKPLAAISQSLNEEDSRPIKDLSKSRSEFGQISRLIERFFIDRKSLIDEIERRKQAEAQLRLAGEELEEKVAARTEALSESSLLLRSLASQLSLAEEHERRRIADELHDHVGQILVLANMRVQQLKALVVDDQLHPLLEEIQKLVADTLNYSRSLTIQLSPPILREFGFEAAVGALASEFEREYRMLVTVEDQTTSRITDDKMGVLLYRSVGELLTNVAKHSQATTVKIVLATRGDGVVIEVEDDGIGFISDQTNDINNRDGFGLFSVKERLTYLGGDMKIESEPGKGTKVLLFVPAVSTKQS